MSKIQIARAGKDVRKIAKSELSLDTDLVLPKFCKMRKRTTSGNVAHGLTYPPQFMCFREIGGNKWAHTNGGGWEGIVGGNRSSADSTNIAVDVASGDSASWVLIFLDPCEEPTTKPAPSSFGGPVVIVSDDIKKDPDYAHRLDTRYDTFKVFKTGTLSLTLPSVNLAYEASDTRTASVAHGLAYPPVFSPFIPYYSNVSAFYGNQGLSVPSNIDLNGLEAVRIPKGLGGFVDPYYEEAWVWVDSTNINIEYKRTNYDFDAYTFPAATANLYYTVFLNRIDEEFTLP